MNRGVLLDTATSTLPNWILSACGASVVLIWVVHNPDWRPFVWIILLAGLLVTWRRASKHFFESRHAAAWLDQSRKLHGLGVLALDRVEIPAAFLKPLEERAVTPTFSIQWWRILKPLTLPILSLLILQLFPFNTQASLELGNKAALKKKVVEQQNRLEELEKEKLLPNSDIEEMKKDLAELNHAIEQHGSDPMLLEATDRMGEHIEKAEMSALQDLSANIDSTALLQQLTAAGQAMESWQKGEAQERMSELLEKLQKMGLEGTELSALDNKELAALMQQLASGKSLSMPSDPKAMAAMLESMKKWLYTKGSKAGECKLGQCSDSYLTECTNGNSSAALGGIVLGAGAPTRGPGAAELTFGEEKHLESKTFQAHQLPESANPSDFSVPISISALDPKTAPQGDRAATSAGANAEAKTEGRGASIPLRHREAVRRYFSTEEPSKQ